MVALSLALLLPLPSGLARAAAGPDEVTLGKQVVAEVRPLGLTTDASLSALGKRLTGVVKRRELPWRFWVVEDMKEYNVFAAPGGFVFITRSYYEKLNDDETAFVLGHEMAHIDLRHYEKQMSRERRANLGNLALKILTGGSQGWGTAADLGATAYVTHYSRVLEREADFTGYRYAEAAGYDANAAVSALSKLGKEPGLHPWITNIYATHPILSSREDQLAALGGKEPEQIEKRPAAASHKRDLTAGLAPFDPPRPIAVRILGADGKRWENRWRKSFTHQLHVHLLPLGFKIRGRRSHVQARHRRPGGSGEKPAGILPPAGDGERDEERRQGDGGTGRHTGASKGGGGGEAGGGGHRRTDWRRAAIRGWEAGGGCAAGRPGCPVRGHGGGRAGRRGGRADRGGLCQIPGREAGAARGGKGPSIGRQGGREQSEVTGRERVRCPTP